MFHALDRPSVAEELARRRTGAPLEVFVEVNVSGEATKSGLHPDGDRRPAGRRYVLFHGSRLWA